MWCYGLLHKYMSNITFADHVYIRADRLMKRPYPPATLGSGTYLECIQPIGTEHISYDPFKALCKTCTVNTLVTKLLDMEKYEQSVDPFLSILCVKVMVSC